MRGGKAGAAWMTWCLANDPLALMQELAARYGRTFRMSLVNGPGVATGDPALIAEVFGGESDLVQAPNEIVTPLLGERSIVLATGARHKRKRQLMMPPFHGCRMRAYAKIITDATVRHAGSLVEGSEVAILDMTQRISLEVIVRAVFGVQDAARVERFRDVITSNVAAFPAWRMFLPVLHRTFFAPWARYQKSVHALAALLREEIVRGRATRDADRQDILSLLLGARDENDEPMSDDEIVDELRTLVIAGHETTATTLGWALWRLHRHPEVLEKLRGEIANCGQEPEALSKLPFLSAVCDETLRLHPIVPFMRRRLTRDAALRGHDYPAGTVFHPVIFTTHFDPLIFPDPWSFRPERFLNKKYSPYEFFPFGGGDRRCIGAAFANYELQIALGTLLSMHRFRLESDAAIRPFLNGVTLRPAGGITLRHEGCRERKP